MKRKHVSRKHRKVKQNRLWNDKVNTLSIPTTFAVVLMFPVMFLVSYAIISNSCNAIQNEVGIHENKQTALMRELQLEESKWKAMQTPANLERRLLAHGMSMRSPKTGQRIAMVNRPFARPSSALNSVAAN